MDSVVNAIILENPDCGYQIARNRTIDARPADILDLRAQPGKFCTHVLLPTEFSLKNNYNRCIHVKNSPVY